MIWYHGFIVALGGALGAFCRYALSAIEAIYRMFLPWLKLTVNNLSAFVSVLAGAYSALNLLRG